MDYPEADRQLQGRCHKRRKLKNHTYLIRYKDHIAVRLHQTDIIRYFPDGRTKLTCGNWNTHTTRARLNEYAPWGYNVGSHAARFGYCAVLYGAYWRPVGLLPVTLGPDGSVPESAREDLERQEARARERRNAERRERYQERYWILKARRGGKSRKPLTVAMIQAEGNISTRTAMIKVYGLERFLTEIQATVIDTVGEYRLLSYSWGGWAQENRTRERRNADIRALKMTCPSTQVAYIHPVDPGCTTVAEALDWMYQTENYLGRLLAEA